MCKQHTVWFGCGHHIIHRLSTCSFRKTFPSSRGGAPFKACTSQSYLDRDIPGCCPTCYLLDYADELEIGFETEAIRLGLIDYNDSNCEEVSTPESQISLEDWKQEKLEIFTSNLPKCQGTQRTRFDPVAVTWSSRKKTGRKTTLLSIEVKPEDVCGPDAWALWDSVQSTEVTPEDAGWGSDWPTSEGETNTTWSAGSSDAESDTHCEDHEEELCESMVEETLLTEYSDDTIESMPTNMKDWLQPSVGYDEQENDDTGDWLKPTIGSDKQNNDIKDWLQPPVDQNEPFNDIKDWLQPAIDQNEQVTTA